MSNPQTFKDTVFLIVSDSMYKKPCFDQKFYATFVLCGDTYRFLLLWSSKHGTCIIIIIYYNWITNDKYFDKIQEL